METVSAAGGLEAAIAVSRPPGPSLGSDEELMWRWISRRDGSRDEAAFAQLWARHGRAVRRAVLRVLGPAQAFADEVFQETWLEVVRAQSFRQGSFRSFILTVATRKALDRLDAVRVRVPAPTGDVDVARVSAPAPDPARTVHARRAVALVLELVERMRPELRAAWTLRFVEQCSFQEVAASIGTPLGTAKNRVRRACELLAAALQERGVDEVDLDLTG